MDSLEVEEAGAPQVYEGTVLRVEEGRECAVLCASEALDEGEEAGRAAACWNSNAGSADAGPGAAAAAAGGGGPGGAASTTALPYDEYDDDDAAYADAATATATAGEGSSAGDETETFSELSDPGGTEVVFVREGVAVVPGAAAASPLLWAPERILGRLSLVKQYGVLFMAWLPYSRGVLQQDGTFRVAAAGVGAAPGGGGVAVARGGGGGSTALAGGGGGGGRPGRAARVGRSGSDRTLYAVHPIPLSEVAALRRRLPPLGLGPPCLTVVLRSGVTLPPLHFTRGGLKQLIAAMKQHALLLKSGSEPHTYLVNDTADPLCRSLTALELADVLIGGPPPGASATFEPGERDVTPAAAAAAPAEAGAASGALAAAAGGNGVAAAVAAGAATSWVSPAVGLGLAAAVAAAAPSGGDVYGSDGGSGGGGTGRDVSAVSWSWADAPAAAPPPLPARASGDGGFEDIGADAHTFSGDGDGGGGAGAGAGGSDDDDGANGDDGGSVHSDGGGAHRDAAGGGAWAYGIVDAINRFVQNVRGTASGWIGAFDELDDTDQALYGIDDGVDGGGGCGGASGSAGDQEEEDGVEVQVGRQESYEGKCSPTAAAVPSSVAATAAGGGCPSGRPGGASQVPRTGPHCGAVEMTIAGGDWGVVSGHSTSTRLGGGGGIAGACGAADGAASPGASVRSGNADAGDTAGGGGGVAETAVGEFELLDGGGCEGEAAAYPAGRRRPRPPPLSAEEWAAMFDAEGRLVSEARLRDRVFSSGCSPELRREVWKHLLGLYPRGSTAAERAKCAQAWHGDYSLLRGQWQSLLPGQEARCASWRAARGAVDKDVRRTDRGQRLFEREGGSGLAALRNVLLTHVKYDEDLGYCQGMSDVAAPLLVVMRDEAEAFWAFAALMERQRANFGSDLAGMTGQLAALRRLVQLLDPPLHAHLERRDCLSYYFAFRWLLICFKREFKYDEVLLLWETCWACRATRHLHLYLAVAVLVQHRHLILSSDLDFDGMLRLSVGLAGRLALRPLLDTAEALVRYAGEAGREATAELP